ncbi:MAG: sugar ABC transporter permease [Desulfurococcales archaeon]|nr:sugar ABC transporter permease [Desulfurococcales archaeon]
MSSFTDTLERFAPHLFLFPALLLIALFILIPLVWNLYLSMTNFKLIGPTAREYDIIWLDNYLELVSDETFLRALWNSFLFTIFSAIIGQVVLGLLLALAARASLPDTPIGKAVSVLRTLTLVLVFVSWVIPEVVAGYAWAALTEKGGLASLLLGADYRIYAQHPLGTIIVANIWRGTAFSMILFIAAMEAIPRYIYEAAEIDGATPFQRFRHVILPLLAPAILVDFILITIWTFNVFTQPFIMLREALGKEVLWTIFVYNEAVKLQNPSLAAAAANVMFAVVMAMILAYLAFMRRLERWYYAGR